MHFDRRTIVQAALAGIAVPAFASGKTVPRSASYGRKIGIQLYMVAEAYAKDPDGTLRALADIGYREVETDLSTADPQMIRVSFDRHGLRCHNVGLLPTPLRGGLSFQSNTDEIARAAHIIGARYVTCVLFPLPPGVAMRPQTGERVDQMLARVAASVTADDWKRNADFLNKKGAELKRAGLRIAYHNHNAEFAPHGETNGMGILLEHTDPALVDFEMDAAWVVGAGHDPVTLLRAYPGRFKLMHVKDVALTNRPNTSISLDTVPVGSGVIDWPRVLKAATASGVRHFAVEQEPPFKELPMKAARKSFDYLKSLNF